MGLEVYYPQDIRNAIEAAYQANQATAMATLDDMQPSPYARGYNDGFYAALVTLACAFNLLSARESREYVDFGWRALGDDKVRIRPSLGLGE